MGATDSHIPLYLWGDDARFTETHEDKLVVVAFGRVLESCKNAPGDCMASLSLPAGGNFYPSTLFLPI